jgi:hypothetical protein
LSLSKTGMVEPVPKGEKKDDKDRIKRCCWRRDKNCLGAVDSPSCPASSCSASLVAGDSVSSLSALVGRGEGTASRADRGGVEDEVVDDDIDVVRGVHLRFESASDTGRTY